MPADRSAPDATQPNPTQTGFACRECGRTFGRKSDLRRHSDIHGEKKYKCTSCDFKSASKQCLVVHNDTQHEGRTIPCPDCAYKSGDPSSLLRHRIRKHRYVPKGVPRRRKQPKDTVRELIPVAVRRANSTEEVEPQSRFYQTVTVPVDSQTSSAYSPSSCYSPWSMQATSCGQGSSNNDWPSECPTPSSSDYPIAGRSSPAQSIPGYSAAGFSDSEEEVELIVPPTVRSHTQARVPREALNFNNTLLSLEEFQQILAWADASRSLVTSEPTREDYLAVEGIYNMIFPPNPGYLTAEEMYSQIPPSFTSWTDYLQGPITSSVSAIYHST